MIKTYTRDGQDYISTHENRELPYDGVEQDRRIREYMEKHSVSYETAALIIMDEDERTETELAGQDTTTFKINGRSYKIEGVDDDKAIKEYMEVNKCSLEEATIFILDNK